MLIKQRNKVAQWSAANFHAGLTPAIATKRRVGKMVIRGSHKPETAGSIPAPATRQHSQRMKLDRL